MNYESLIERGIIKYNKLIKYKIMDEYSDSDWNWNFYEELVDDVDENKNIIQCISCGKCVGDCPASKVSNFNIRKIIGKVLRGDKSVLKDSDIWYCFLFDNA